MKKFFMLMFCVVMALAGCTFITKDFSIGEGYS